MEENKNPQPVSGEETEVMASPLNENNESEVSAKEASGQNWKNVMLGGIPGILLGVGGVFAAQAFTVDHGSDNGGHGSHGGHGDGGNHEEGDIPVADSVNDEMSFREAFEAARAEVGPGGAFSWHGNVYSTYRSDDPEWVEMGPDGQAAHCHEIVVQVQAEPYHTTPAPTPSPEPDPVPDPTPDPDPEPDPTPDPEPDPVDLDVQIVDVVVDSESGQSAAIGYVNGHETAFVDLDGDNNVDIVLHDANDDGEISSDEVADATGSGITIDDLSGGSDYESGGDLDVDGGDVVDF